ncbi:phage tail tape measure protein [Pediococcus acidilactici]|uniref:phage tail tape measure protein n=1 Tax=Pediococcus acidilactici TaxID=1254 RepID=UPI00233051AE|nr:phage tail tape measure protein [Pediococcus acidilactici]MDB8858806.1 phage tail tape measure protein [Pediococcus acidilactici]MDB8861096.1 phage tail tape measure protein [Pediococcus acidilactici]MDB8862012.1 phage tail tape measure protein [Pediococcus acidilactici]MDB8865987.1 phage tail tape measure protein [Pediococcus acidilactici]
MADEPLGRMVIELGLDHSAFGKGMAGVRKEVKYSMAEMKSSMAVIGQSGSKFDVLSAKAKGLSQVMMSQERLVEKLGNAYKGTFVNGKATAQTGKLATQMQNANAKLAALRKQYINNAAAMAKARVETTGFTGGLNKVSKAAITTGTAMKNVGSSMTTKVSAPIAAGLAYATKSAVKFDSQIKAIGPLLTNGATVTAKYKAQLDQLGDASKRMSTKYGVSTTEINNGMTELVRRGYTTKQVLGSMPSIMDATVASGEDMGTVLNTTSSIVEQFGLKTKSTAGTLKNTQMVTDSITYAANATAAGFSDMGEAMSYVGPQAHAAGLSVQETAAAIGELSNKGIEGQKAGTNLRGILTSLVKVTPNASKAFKSMGISTSELKKDASDLPRLIDDITKGTKDWSKADRNKAIATAFGRENQSAMNALLETGSSKLRQLTKDTENSTGATKKQAEQLSNTSENNVKKLIASLQVLGIEVGAKLVPKLIPLVNKAKDLVDGFSDLDDSTQNTIIKFALLAAAGGPVLSLTGKLISGFGKVGSTIVGAASKIAEWGAKTQAAKTVLGDVAGAAATTGSKVEAMGTSAATAKGGISILGTALTTTEAGAGVLGTSLTVAGAAVTGVGLAALAGVTYWELYGKKAHESAQRVKEWGSDIGKNASDAAGQMAGFETKASTALDGFNSNVQKNAKEVNKAFDSMVSSASKNVDKKYKNAQKLAKQIGGQAGQALLEEAEKEKSANEKQVQDMANTAQKVKQITAQSAKDGVKLTSDQATTIANLQRKMAQDEINTLGLKSKQKKAILAAELGETGSMTKKQLAQTAKEIGDASYKEVDTYNRKYGKIKQAQKNGLISAKEANAAEEQLTKAHNATLTQLGEDLIRTEKEQGKSRSDILADLEMNGFTDKQAEKAMAEYTKSLKQTASTAIKITGDMSKSTQKAAKEWNSMVLDPKTGKLKTNAQEEVDKAAKNKDKWNSMMLLAKKGEMSTNAAAMVGVAAVNVKKWDGLTLKEKKALIATKGGDDLASMIEKGKQWNKFTPAEKKAIISAKGKSELLTALSSLKTWNKLSVKEKKAVIKDNASPAMKQAKIGIDQWNNLTPNMKTVVAKAKGANDVAKGVKNVKDWNSLPTKEKTLIANDKNARSTIKNVTSDYKKYENLPKSSVKNLLAKDNASKNANKAKISVDKYGRIKMPNPIGLKATDKASGPAKNAKKNVDKFNSTKMQTKTAKGKDSASGPMKTARNSTLKYNGVKMATKTAKGKDAASGPMSSARISLGKYNGVKMQTKQAKAKDSASGPIKGAIDWLSKWNAMKAVTHVVKTIYKKLTGHAMGTLATDGNPIMVNDQEGPVYRELVKYPGRPAFIPHGRNVVLEDAPKGTKVIPAALTAQLTGIRKLATGKISVDSAVVQASKAINDSLSPNNSSPANQGFGGMTDTSFIAGAGQTQQFDSFGDQLVATNQILSQLLEVSQAQLKALLSQGGFDRKAFYRQQARDLALSTYNGIN